MPTPAFAKSRDEAEKVLTSYGVPEIAPTEDPPFGWRIVVEPVGIAPDAYYGKFKLGSEPLVVTFVTPSGWVVSKPNIDFNGSAGTVQANDYGKGDSATLWIDTSYTGNLQTMTSIDYKMELLKALTQKGKNFIEDLKIEKVSDGPPGYKVCEYTYDIESGAGFTISRSGIGSFTQVGDKGNLQIFWTGVITPRWKNMKNDLGTIARSFRIGKVPKGASAFVKDFKNLDEAMSATDIPKA